MTTPRAPEVVKTATESAMPVKQPQANGRGALYSGGVPGNAGGSGRPPSALRAAARIALDKRIALLSTFAGSRKVRTADRIASIALLARIGLEESLAVSDVRSALDATGELLRDRLPPDVAEALVTDIRAIWLAL